MMTAFIESNSGVRRTVSINGSLEPYHLPRQLNTGDRIPANPLRFQSDRSVVHLQPHLQPHPSFMASPLGLHASICTGL